MTGSHVRPSFQQNVTALLRALLQPSLLYRAFEPLDHCVKLRPIREDGSGETKTMRVDLLNGQFGRRWQVDPVCESTATTTQAVGVIAEFSQLVSVRRHGVRTLLLNEEEKGRERKMKESDVLE